MLCDMTVEVCTFKIDAETYEDIIFNNDVLPARTPFTFQFACKVTVRNCEIASRSDGEKLLRRLSDSVSRAVVRYLNPLSNERKVTTISAYPDNIEAWSIVLSPSTDSGLLNQVEVKSGLPFWK